MKFNKKSRKKLCLNNGFTIFTEIHRSFFIFFLKLTKSIEKVNLLFSNCYKMKIKKVFELERRRKIFRQISQCIQF